MDPASSIARGDGLRAHGLFLQPAQALGGHEAFTTAEHAAFGYLYAVLRLDGGLTDVAPYPSPLFAGLLLHLRVAASQRIPTPTST